MSNTDLLSSEAANTVSSSDAASAAGQQESKQPDGDLPAGAGTNGTSRRRGGLSGMVLAELRELAGELGINSSGLRKGDLIAAIKERQAGVTVQRGRSAKESATEQPTQAQDAKHSDNSSSGAGANSEAGSGTNGSDGQTATRTRPERGGNRGRRRTSTRNGDARNGEVRGDVNERSGSNQSGQSSNNNTNGNDGDQRSGDRNERNERNERNNNSDRGSDRNSGSERNDRNSDRNNDRNSDRNNASRNNDDADDDNGRRRGRRFRDRRRNRGRGEGGNEPEVREDDVLLPIAGILDVLENYAFVRTSGYLAGPNDVYVSLSLVRKYGLRRGDAIKGVIRQPREGEQQRQKFNPLVRVDAINGQDVEAARNRQEFHKLTPLYPNERLRLETEPQNLTGRVIDLVMPVGKGQRALIVSPPKAGKTMVLQAIANAITANNPECHLMVVLVDERPEEVTDMQRSVDGEVIAATFDRPASDHTTLAELAIERAKRLVEMNHDVVVLLDSVTRLGRSYNLAAPASGRILSGGVDSTALYPPKRFLGAARNIEHGGSLTIFATALVETGSTMDTVIFEEFKGTGNAELKLDRKLADKRLFPAVDVDASSTRKDEILLSPDELAVTHKLRRVLAALDTQQSLELLQERLRKNKTNIEFLMQVAKSTPGKDEE